MIPSKSRLLWLLCSCLAVGCGLATQQSFACDDWPLWRAYTDRFIQGDGRVVEFSAEGRTTSEGQAYALFFSLVSNDRERFERILDWTERNLVQGPLGEHLPAWLWGRDDDGQWQVLDQNSASDADLWIAYTLLQAGRLWEEPDFSAQGKRLMTQIKSKEVITLPNLGPMLLPAPEGFRLNEGTWRFNPSYAPLHILRALTAYDPQGPWQPIADNTLAMIKAVSPRGLVPDWVAYAQERGFLSDPVAGAVGSFDAIRVYLWAGMLPNKDPLSDPLLESIYGMRSLLHESGIPPMYVDALTGVGRNQGPAGFSAALLPYLRALGASSQLEIQQQRLATHRPSPLVGQVPRYYDQNLALFGEGALENRIRFDVHGRLIPQWTNTCHSSAAHLSS